MTGELNGKRILVTGGATGIGAAAVEFITGRLIAVDGGPMTLGA